VSVPSPELGPPAPASQCVSPLDPKGEEQHSLAGEREGPNSEDIGQKAWHSVYSVQYCEQYFSTSRAL
jgi:hypothetical protein